jgi:RNA polymerase sigma factor (TIGR02999 family)
MDNQGGVDLTGLLGRWHAGDRSVENEIFAELYPLLRSLAQRSLGDARGYTVQPTELAHEAYLRLAEQQRVDWKNRGHFFAIAGRVVRRVVIDYLRERGAQKRGAGDDKISLDEINDSDLPLLEAGSDWLRLDLILNDLEKVDPAAARLVEQRYFAGLSVDEIAAAQGVSRSSVNRQWRLVRAWLEASLGTDC